MYSGFFLLSSMSLNHLASGKDFLPTSSKSLLKLFNKRFESNIMLENKSELQYWICRPGVPWVKNFGLGI